MIKVVFWGNTDSDPTKDDVQLDVDEVAGNGPESIQFGPDTAAGVWTVAVNVYQHSEVEGEDCSVVTCQFLGGIRPRCLVHVVLQARGNA